MRRKGCWNDRHWRWESNRQREECEENGWCGEARLQIAQIILMGGREIEKQEIMVKM
jgi:hypothetical protein